MRKKHTYSLSYFVVPDVCCPGLHWIYTKSCHSCLKKVVRTKSGAHILDNTQWCVSISPIKTLDCARVLHNVRITWQMRKHTYSLSYFKLFWGQHSAFPTFYTERYLYSFEKVVQMASNPNTHEEHRQYPYGDHLFAQGSCTAFTRVVAEPKHTWSLSYVMPSEVRIRRRAWFSHVTLSFLL